MKKIILSLAMAAAIVSCNSSKTVDDPLAESGRTQRTENLLANLREISANGYLVGHQDDPVYGVGWVGDSCRSDVKSVCNDYPAVIGFDLGHLELGDSVNLDGVPFDRMKQEIIRQRHYLEEKFQVVITEDDIKHAIQIENRRRIALKRLYEVMKLDPVPIMGMELLDVLYGSKYKLNLEKVPKELDALTNQILEEYEEKPKKEHRPRILITGCPIGGDSKKVVKAIENNGGVVVAFENCTGAKVIDKLVDENNPDVYDAIAKKYFYIGCAIMTPNDNRIELLGRMIDDFKVDGVVEMILSGCHSVQMESISVRNFVNEEKHIPYLDIVTDYSQGDIGQLNTRMAAFIEMLRMK